MMEKLWTIAILLFGLYWINPLITVFACQLINAANWFNFHENVKKNIREKGSTKIDI